MSANQTPNVAFADALERAKQIAAKLCQNPTKHSDAPAIAKRSAVDSGDEEPELKKTATENEVITPQMATLKAQQVAKQINEQLGILKSGDYSEDLKIGQTNIARQNDIIKRLSEQYGVKISMEGNPNDISAEKPIRITGDPEKVARARQAIEQLASGGNLPLNSMQGVYGEYGNRTSDSVVIESQFNVPAEKAGIVIGKGGESIKDINRRSGAYVEIDRNQKPGGPGTFKIFNIRGTQEQITKAQHMIYDKCVNSPGGAPNMVPPPGHCSFQSQSSHTPHYGSDMHAFPHFTNPMHHMDPYSAYPQAPMGGYPLQPAVAPWPAYNPEPWQQAVPNAALSAMGAGTNPLDPNRPVAAMDWSSMYPGYFDPQQQATQMMNPALSVTPTSTPTSAAVVSAPPVTNPQTGQPDYSLAWVEYYRSIGLHAQADFILSHAAQNNLISNPSNQMPTSNGASAGVVSSVDQNQQTMGDQTPSTLNPMWNANSNPNSIAQNPQIVHPHQQSLPQQQPQMHHLQMGQQTSMLPQQMGMPMQQAPQMQPHQIQQSHPMQAGHHQMPSHPPPPPPSSTSPSSVGSAQMHLSQQPQQQSSNMHQQQAPPPQPMQSHPPMPPQQSQDGMHSSSWPHNLQNTNQ